MVIISFILFIFGVIILAKSSSLLVDGASSIAKSLNISPLFIGLTVVAFATSAPELMVSISAALSDSTEIALGNVIGSNIFNTLFLIGLSAVILPLSIKKITIRREIPISLFATFVVFLFILSVFLVKGININLTGTEVLGFLNFYQGIILLVLFSLFIIFMIVTAKRKESEEINVKELSTIKSSTYIVGGMIGLALASKYLILDSGIDIAETFGMSQTLIGLSLISIGTSLPELATVVAATLKKNSDIAVGNIIGSNIFNLLLVLGVTLVIKPIPIIGQNLFDISFLFITTLLVVIFVFFFSKFKINRIEGSILILIYAIYLVYIFVR